MMAIVELVLWVLMTAYWFWRLLKLVRTFRANNWPARVLYFESIMLIALLVYGLQIVPAACRAIAWCR